jgi:hypothetical protein
MTCEFGLFHFFCDVLIIFLLIMIATWAIAGAIYRIAVGAQDCVLRPKDGVLSQKYANRRSGFFKQAFHRIQESSDFSRRQKPRNHRWALKTAFEAKTLRTRSESSDFRFSQKIKGIILRPAKQCLRSKLCELAANRQFLASEKMKTSASE